MHAHRLTPAAIEVDRGFFGQRAVTRFSPAGKKCNGVGLDRRSLEKPFSDFATCAFVAVHVRNSDERVFQPRIGNHAMFVTLAVGRRGRRVVQLLVAVHHEIPPWKWHRHDARAKTRADQAASLAGIGCAAVHGTA
ncbi:hypothetical protein PPH41_02015 [Burkholderia gladioli]|nr:hypothetical protein [Burkholderia gladioli]